MDSGSLLLTLGRMQAVQLRQGFADGTIHWPVACHQLDWATHLGRP